MHYICSLFKLLGHQTLNARVSIDFFSVQMAKMCLVTFDEDDDQQKSMTCLFLTEEASCETMHVQLLRPSSVNLQVFFYLLHLNRDST